MTILCLRSLQPQVPDTPEEEGLAAAADQQPQAQQQQQLNGGGEALLRQALRRSAEKARNGDGSDLAAPAPLPAAAAAAASAVHPQQTAGPPAGQASAAPPAATALTRDLTNQPHLGAPASAAPHVQAGAPPPFRPVLPPQLGAGGPVPLAQHQRQQQPASFLAGARAALQEASAGGVQQGPQQQQVQLQHAQRVPLQPAAARPGHAPQLPLHRSPHAEGLASVPIPVTAAAPADRTPQALQLGLERTLGVEGGAPLSGQTDGGALFASGGCCLLRCLGVLCVGAHVGLTF